jgi:hypothetical protein
MEYYLCLSSIWRPILAFKADLEISDEVLKPRLDAKSGKNIVKSIFNFDDDFPIQKKVIINFDCEQSWPHPLIYAT